MAEREIHLERLVGRRVRSASGETVGRIEETKAERQGDEWVVKEYLLGPYALLERLSPRGVVPAVRRALRSWKARRGYVMPWDKLDLAHPVRPRLLCPVEELNPPEAAASGESG